uniref:Uncharacterized protein n=1 Tax=viral metagenome TaxID=1070528 RepID=A0A6H1Z6L9_9ZZZZ
MIQRRTWREFQDAKLLWWINRILHTFGWAIVVELSEDTKEITDVYPARVRFRGFSEAIEERGFIGLTEYLAETADDLLAEAKE